MCSDKNLNYLFRKCINGDYVHNKSGADYAIERVGRRLYLLFEWSDGVRDWKNNLDFPARAYCSGDDIWFVHRGFLRVWKSVRHEICELVASSLAAHPTDEIICIGYSHGAALCGLCTENMVFLHGQELRISGYGFGCPRFIWGRLPPSVRERFSHFTPIRNIPDIVTHLPPAIFGYSHASKLLFIGSRGKYSPIDAHRPEAYLAETRCRNLYSFGDAPVFCLKV